MPQFYHHCPEKTPTLNESPHRGRFVVPPVGEGVLGDGQEPRHKVDVRGRAVGSLKLESETDDILTEIKVILLEMTIHQM